MKAKLISPDASPPEWEIELQRFPVIIGRSSEAEIQPIDAAVSERHCELEEMNGCLIVHDLGSEHGTFVNGVQVDVARLLPGDMLTVGKSNFVASYARPEREVAPRSAMSLDDDRRCLARHTEGIVTLADLAKLLDQQRRIFRKQYNRASTQVEPMFPDPPHPEHLEHLLVQEMQQAGVDPQYIFAFEKTGILVTELNFDSIDEDEMMAWQAAVEEYEDRHDCDVQQRFPLGIVTMYGPDKSTTTTIVAAVMIEEDSEPIQRRWAGHGVAADLDVKRQMTEFFRAHRVHSVIYVSENVGCPHQEGLDYPIGEECPYCPYWKDQNRSSR